MSKRTDDLKVGDRINGTAITSVEVLDEDVLVVMNGEEHFLPRHKTLEVG